MIDKLVKPVYLRRVPELLRIEGWYDLPEVELKSRNYAYTKVDGRWQDIITKIPATRVKISCRFEDILRCSDFPQPRIPPTISAGRVGRWLNKTAHPIHFKSCFSSADGDHYNVRAKQPLLRCTQIDNCAIVYLPDRHGNFQARAFLWYKRQLDGEYYYEMDKVYGNGLDPNLLIKQLMYNTGLNCRYNLNDTYLAEG